MYGYGSIGIKDSNRLVHFACDAIRAIRYSILFAVEYVEYNNAIDALRVIIRVLESIVKSIEENVDEIDKCISTYHSNG